MPRVSRPIVSQLWIAGAKRALDTELQGVSQDSVAEVRAHLRVAAITAEDLLNIVGRPAWRGANDHYRHARRALGDQALDIDYVGAAFIEEAVARALVEIVNSADCTRLAGLHAWPQVGTVSQRLPVVSAVLLDLDLGQRTRAVVHPHPEHARSLSLIRAMTGADDAATSTRQISTASISSIRVRVRMTAVWVSAASGAS